MKFFTQNRHVIDLIFPISVFFVFAASSVAVILLAADSYNSQTKDSANHFMTCTSLSYVNEKIHQNDLNGGISIQTLEGQKCLSIESQSGNAFYTTYIYKHEGMLKELFVRNDAEVHLSAGKTIMEVKDFTIDALDENLFRFTSVDMDGNTNILIVSERSTP